MARDVGSTLVGPDLAEPDRWPLVGRSTEIIATEEVDQSVGAAPSSSGQPGWARRPWPRSDSSSAATGACPSLWFREPRSPDPIPSEHLRRSSTATRTWSVPNRTPISSVATRTSCSTTPDRDRCWSSSTTHTSSTTARPPWSISSCIAGAATVLACVLSSARSANPAASIPWSSVEGLRRRADRARSARRSRRSRTSSWPCSVGPSTLCRPTDRGALAR